MKNNSQSLNIFKTRIISNKLFPNVNYNTFITLLPKYICKVLLAGSTDASYDENISILDDVFKYIDSTKRFNTFQELIDISTDNQFLFKEV